MKRLRSFFALSFLTILSFGTGCLLIEGFFRLNSTYGWFQKRWPDVVRSDSRITLEELPGFSLSEIPVSWSGTKAVDYYVDGLPDFNNSWKDGVNIWMPEFLEMKPNGVFHQEVRTAKTKKLVLRATYSTDEFGRRNTPGQPLKYKNDIAFLGCSFIFGDGLSDDQTVPFYLQKLRTEERVINLGIQGSGASVWLSKLSGNRFRGTQDLGSSPRFLYNFIDDHVRREVGTASFLRAGPHVLQFPAYEIREGKVVSLGTLADKYGPFADLMLVLAQSLTLDFLNLDFPFLSDDSVELEASLIKAIESELNSRYPASTFDVVIYPGANRFGPKLARLLKEKKVRVYDFSSYDFHAILKGQNTKEDSHPTALANKLYAALIERNVLR